MSWKFLILLCLLFVTALIHSSDQQDEFLGEFAPDVSGVNDETLVFLTEPPGKLVHHHQHWITANPTTLDDGWVTVRQCHHHLDPVALSQITFRKGRVRELKILSSDRIGRVWVEADSIQLEDVEKGASLCLKGELRLVTKLDRGGYLLRSGPFMRRFLDGYYPLRVSYELDYRDLELELAAYTPSDQAGFQTIRTPVQFGFDAWFEGRLDLNLIFKGNQ